MKKTRTLLLLSTAAPLVFGILALVAPAQAAPPGNGCKRSCPPTKKLHGYTCVFVGCDPATGACLYGC